jgi:polynucleotide 5'-hydroxyl-kinase GRC3/NOL9
MDMQLEIPDAWNALDVSDWHGSILIVGASNSGKSTFARYLYTRLLSVHPRVGYLDADVGQSSLGTPATITMAIRHGENERSFPPTGPRRVCFVGNNTPLRHIPVILLSLYRMQLFAIQQQVDALVVDTSGLIDPLHGGTDLKWGKVELFRPCRVVAFQRKEELEPILAPLRHLSGVRLHELPVAEAVRRRAYEERCAYRAARYRDYFVDAQRIPLSYSKLAVFPEPRFLPGRLVGLEGRDGFILALGIVERADERVLWLQTPWSGRGRVAALRLGDLLLNGRTFQEMRIRNWEL